MLPLPQIAHLHTSKQFARVGLRSVWFQCSGVHVFRSSLQVGRQPVHYAAEEGHLHAVEVLIDNMGPDAIWNPVADKVGKVTGNAV